MGTKEGPDVWGSERPTRFGMLMGYGLGMGLLWFLVWVWYGFGTSWIRFRNALGMGLVWFGYGFDMVFV